MADDTPKSRVPEPGHGIPGGAATWLRTADLFAAALDQPAAGRLAWLDTRTDVDPEIRTEVASLLLAFEKAGGFLDPDRIRLSEPADDFEEHD